jgi:cytoskeletal protein CcmA (bactofilin family)
MFSGKSEKQAEPIPGGGLSVIAPGMTVRGDIESDGTVKVEGVVEGQVQARNQVLVAKGGTVQGDIDARESIVGGTVQGSIRATERVEVQAGATVRGDITTRRIAVAEGGNLNGAIKMTEALDETKADLKPAPKPEAKPQASVPVVPSMSRPSIPVARVAVPPRQPQGGGH